MYEIYWFAHFFFIKASILSENIGKNNFRTINLKYMTVNAETEVL